MSKIKVKISFNDKEISYNKIYTAIYKEDLNEVVYKENNDITMKYSFTNKILTRITSEFTAEYHLKEKLCIITINELNKSMQIPIVINRMLEKKNILEIEYIIEENKVYYKLEKID